MPVNYIANWSTIKQPCSSEGHQRSVFEVVGHGVEIGIQCIKTNPLSYPCVSTIQAQIIAGSCVLHKNLGSTLSSWRLNVIN